MKKRPSLRPKKKSRFKSKKVLMVNRKLLVIGSLLFLFICGFIILNDETLFPNNSVSSYPVQSSSNYKIILIDNSTGGDVSNNAILMENINQTHVISEIIQSAKKGTPLIIFGDGSQPRVMVVAGVHGAELPSQIAATNLINHLNGKKLNGTVYIVPFAIPNNTASSTRINNGTDPDRVAHNNGTPLNNINNVSLNSNITLMVDFHSAQPNDVPGKNCIIYDPKNPKSHELAGYIRNKTGSPLMEVGLYPGVLSTVSNRNGIPSVVCEVLSAHNKTDQTSIDLTYQYMLAFLEYSGVYTTND